MTSEESKEKKRPSAEELFLARGQSNEPDEFDEELFELTKTRERGSVLRPILMITVISLVIWVIYDWQDELAYFFSSSEPVELENVADFSLRKAEEPDWDPPVGHNQYVSLSGVPMRISSSEKYEIFRLMGAEIYVQREIGEERMREDDKPPSHLAGGVLPVDEYRQPYSGSGRMISFAAAPQQVAGVKSFFGEHYGTRFCEDYSQARIEDMERRELQQFRVRWERRYQEADEEQRQQRGLTPEPDSAQEERYLAENPVCVDAYLVRDGQRPRDQWWHLVFSAFLAIFALFNAYKLVEWFRRWLRA